MSLPRFGDDIGKGGSGVSLSVEARLEVRRRDGSPSSTMVDILRDLPDTIDEELARVEDLEGVLEASDSGVSSCSVLLNVPERLRRDRALFTERNDVGYRSVIAEPVSKNETACPRQAQVNQSSQGRRGMVKVRNNSDSGICDSFGFF